MTSVAFALWLIGAVIGVLRAARRTPPAPARPGAGRTSFGGGTHAPDRRLTPRPAIVHTRPLFGLGW